MGLYIKLTLLFSTLMLSNTVFATTLVPNTPSTDNNMTPTTVIKETEALLDILDDLNKNNPYRSNKNHNNNAYSPSTSNYSEKSKKSYLQLYQTTIKQKKFNYFKLLLVISILICIVGAISFVVKIRTKKNS